MWSAHPQSPKSNGEAQITKRTAKLGNFPEPVGRPPSEGKECVPTPGLACANMWVQSVSYSKHGKCTSAPARAGPTGHKERVDATFRTVLAPVI